MAKAITISDHVFKAFVDAGLITDEEHVVRLVLDLQAGYAPIIHVQRFADERLLTVVPSLDGVEIRRGDQAV